MKTTNFVSSVLAFHKGGDEAKVTRFADRYIKANNKQISIRKDEIGDIKEAIDDLDEKTREDLISVNLDSIKTSDNIDSYINVYRSTQLSNLRAKTSLEARVAELEAEIVEFEALNAMLTGESNADA